MDEVCIKVLPHPQFILVQQVYREYLEEVESKLKQNVRECVLGEIQDRKVIVSCGQLTLVGTSEESFRIPST